MARDYKDPTAVNSGYTVRRLTPTECARLQGFPGLVVRWLGNPGADQGGHRVLDGGLGDTPKSRESLREAQDGAADRQMAESPLLRCGGIQDVGQRRGAALRLVRPLRHCVQYTIISRIILQSQVSI